MHGSNRNRHRRFLNRRLISGVGACALVAALAGSALAQDGTVVIGGSGAPDVQVNMGAVYGGYGYGPNGRRLLMPNSKHPPGAPIVLKPPGAHRTAALKPPSLKAPKKEAVVPAATEPAVSEEAAPAAAPTPPPPPKLSELPPPPPAKKVVPVESTALTPAETAAKAGGETSAPPVPPPEPPAPSAAKTSPAKNGKEKSAAAAIQAAATAAKAPEAAPPPPPPPAGTETAAAPPPPPPPGGPTGESTGAAPSEAKPAATGEQPAEVAALPPPAQPVGGEKPKSIAFAVGVATLADQAKEDLSAIAQSLTANADLRLQIVAYATGSDDNASQARRLSLSRALAVRSYLIDAGVRSTRMDVRALGNKFDTGPGDRVDLIVVKP